MSKTSFIRLLAGAALLTLAAFLLFWRMPNNVGLGAMGYLMLDALLALVLGLVAMQIAFVTRWLPKTLGWGAAAFGAWVVLPLIAGPVLGTLLLAGLLEFYWSDWYAQFNSDRLGVTIELQDQDFEFANCRISAYTATYHIEAQRTQNLTFGLRYGDDLWFFERGDQLAQSIGEQFQYVGEGDAGWSMALGLYQITAGSHTLVVRNYKPFLLQIYDPTPLWTPDLILAGNEHYAMLYGEDFSRADIEALAQPYLPASCAPLGCTPGETKREPPATPVAEEDSAAIGAVTEEQAIPSAQGGQYDALELAVTLDITTTGNYMLKGELHSADHRQATWDRYNSMEDGPLCPGSHTIKLHFRGDEIRDAGVDGPYTVSLALEYDSPTASYPPTVDRRDDAYTTADYAASQFGDAMQGPLRTAERTPDLDGNGLYDQLVIEVFINLQEPASSEWLGALVGASGCQAGNAAGAARLDAEMPAAFVFTGGSIRHSRCDGPYTLTDVFNVSSG